MEAKEILKKHFEIAKAEHPSINYKNFDECDFEIEFIVKAMVDYSLQQTESIESKLNNLKGEYNQLLLKNTVLINRMANLTEAIDLELCKHRSTQLDHINFEHRTTNENTN